MAHPMRWLASLAVLAAAVAGSAHAQTSADAADSIARTLNTPESQWVFNHLCVPEKLLAGHGYTQGDFAAAYLIVSRARWQLAQDALARQDEAGSMSQLALILHGVSDAYWPDRISRDSAGAITQLGNCDTLGNLKGMLQAERDRRRPDARSEEVVMRLMTQLIKKWKERKPFDEVAPLLTGGPMNLSASAASLPLNSED